MDTYTRKFAAFYDKGWNSFSVKVFDYFKKEIENKDVCDVACGTGNFIKLSKKVVRSICGIDISKDFIAYARKQNPEVNFKVINIENLDVRNQYDIVVCWYDSVNHFDNWEKAFRNIYRSLRKNGKFIFDINTVQGLKRWNKTFLNKVDSGYIYMESQVLPKNSARMKIKIFNQDRRLIDDLEMVEKTYPVKEVKKLLKLAGFKKIKNIRNIINPKNKGRVFFKCVK
jgi:SAM-dependent methyltransferase